MWFQLEPDAVVQREASEGLPGVHISLGVLYGCSLNLAVKQENNHISMCCVTSTPFTSKEAPTHPGRSGH